MQKLLEAVTLASQTLERLAAGEVHDAQTLSSQLLDAVQVPHGEPASGGAEASSTCSTFKLTAPHPASPLPGMQESQVTLLQMADKYAEPLPYASDAYAEELKAASTAAAQQAAAAEEEEAPS